MFEHKYLDGEKHRLLASSQEFLKESILESREPIPGGSVAKAPRLQHAVAGSVLVERYLPPEGVGESWSHDPGAIWWEVVGHPPHGGIVADFNKEIGGEYHRKLAPDHNIVAYAEKGEEVVLTGGEYKVTRADGEDLTANTLSALRSAYYG